MKAAVCDRYGPPEVVRIAGVEKPTPQAGEVLVKVHASTVNRTDSGVRSARPFIARFFYGLTRLRARILGNEFAGGVEAVGSGVTSIRPGDRVFGFNAGFGRRGEFGAHAEYLVRVRGIPQAVPKVRELIESGRFRPVIDRRYPLERIVEAHRYLDSGQKVGGVVIRVVPPDDVR